MVSLRVRLIREHNRMYSHVLKWLWKFQGRDAARAYMFHSVVDTQNQVYSKFAITRESFERFIRYELSRGQQPMDAETLKNAVDNPIAYKNHFVVTFDDIYDSVYLNAYPVLKANNVPFVLFVSPSVIDKEDMISHNLMIKMEHLREMACDPLCVIAAHGLKHAAYRMLTDELVSASMEGAKIWLENTFEKPVEFFAFPFGRRVEVSKDNITSLSRCGYYCGFSALDGTLKQKWFSGRWFLPRILVDDEYVKRSLEDAKLIVRDEW